jgi:hypothetical protein
MGTEYYLESHDNKTYYFLGKGSWHGCDELSVLEYETYNKKLVDSFSNIEALKSFLNEPYNMSGKTPQSVIDRVADELFILFGNSKSLDVFSDSYHCPPKDYRKVGKDIYELRGFVPSLT